MLEFHGRTSPSAVMRMAASPVLRSLRRASDGRGLPPDPRLTPTRLPA